MYVTFEAYFYSVTFVTSRMCQVYFTKEKIKLIYFPSFEYTMIFML
jgi:hypothetical protein